MAMYSVRLNNRILTVKNNQIQIDKIKSVATIGNFDGLHLGHLHLLAEMNAVANKYQLYRKVITFEPLPLEYFSDKQCRARLPRLSLLRDKALLLKYYDLADELIIIRFDASCSNLSPDTFIQRYLIEKLNVVHVVMGDDFKFGYNRAGGVSNFAQYDIATTIVEPIIINNQRVSSSLLRNLAGQNLLPEVKLGLGRNIQYTSKVIHGNHIGRTLGVPTINLCLGRNHPALWGIYLAFVHIEGVKYKAVASIGKNPTVSGRGVYQLEAHLLDVDLDLYGKIATIEILEFMREELKFDSMQDLVLQMQVDLFQARNKFKDGVCA